MHVIRILARADGQPDPNAGKFIRDFDPAYGAGRGLMTTTPHRHRAKRFPDAVAAMAYWQTETPTGRPLTAYTVTIEPHQTP